jgi:hypothetical protein
MVLRAEALNTKSQGQRKRNRMQSVDKDVCFFFCNKKLIRKQERTRFLMA